MIGEYGRRGFRRVAAIRIPESGSNQVSDAGAPPRRSLPHPMARRLIALSHIAAPPTQLCEQNLRAAARSGALGEATGAESVQGGGGWG